MWLGSSLADLRDFPDHARRRAGHALRMVQQGLMPPDWKALPPVGPGVNEIRVRTGREFRVLYVAKYAEAVYVAHVFEKKTRRIPPADVVLARRRLAGIRRGIS